MRDAVGAEFQSTLSVRRATGWCQFFRLAADISIHALREESDPPRWILRQRVRISIHALREESDTSAIGLADMTALFQSTLSVRRATDGIGLDLFGGHDFNPRSP